MKASQIAGLSLFSAEGWNKNMQPHSPAFKHISAKHAEILYGLYQEGAPKARAKAEAVTTVNPLLITVLFWFLPGFFLIHNFVIRYVWVGLLQMGTLVGSVLTSNWLASQRQLRSVLKFQGKDVTEMTSTIDDTDVILKCLLIFLILWFLFDGVTIYPRTRSSNFRKVQRALGA